MGLERCADSDFCFALNSKNVFAGAASSTFFGLPFYLYLWSHRSYHTNCELWNSMPLSHRFQFFKCNGIIGMGIRISFASCCLVCTMRYERVGKRYSDCTYSRRASYNAQAHKYTKIILMLGICSSSCHLSSTSTFFVCGCVCVPPNRIWKGFLIYLQENENGTIFGLHANVNDDDNDDNDIVYEHDGTGECTFSTGRFVKCGIHSWIVMKNQ